MFGQVRTHRSPTGARRSGWRHFGAAGEPQGILVISHGLAEHSGPMPALPKPWPAKVSTFTPMTTARHGTSLCPDACPAMFAQRDGAAKVVAISAPLRDMAVASHPGLPVVLFGHSMGGLIALNAAETDPELYDALLCGTPISARPCRARRPSCCWRSKKDAEGFGRAKSARDENSPSVPGAPASPTGRPISIGSRAIRARLQNISKIRSVVSTRPYRCGSTYSPSPLPAPAPTGCRRLPSSLPVHLAGAARSFHPQRRGRSLAGQPHESAGHDGCHDRNSRGHAHETLNEIGREKR